MFGWNRYNYYAVRPILGSFDIKYLAHMLKTMICIKISDLKRMIAYQINSSGMATRFTPKTLWEYHLSWEDAPVTYWGRVCIYVCSHNGLSPGRHRTIVWTIAGILLIEPLGTNFSEKLIKSRVFSFRKIQLNVLSGKWKMENGGHLISASMR